MTTIWELDFYSRPIVDEQNKKVWEVLICESPLTLDADVSNLFRYSEYCPNSQVNSIWLAEALNKAIAQAPTPPDRVRFFRQAMNNMVTKACGDVGIPAQLSRRTFALNQWLSDRLATVYPQEAGYQAGANPTVAFPLTPPQPLPDALRGQKWSLVSLEASAFADMQEWSIDFGEAFPLQARGLAPDAQIPGLIIYTSRALPMAAWMSGLELSAVKYDTHDGQQLVLETGVIERWTLTPLPKPELQAEAQRFEADKKAAKGVHFIAIQSGPESDAFAGFWLLLDDTIA
ncbi:Tab2/Atab2 family RNA-binding protein [Alkalinema pantanalense CENA528]|uniref:Tab2/Atab2 family RNA-binding protein n=1 Tax=Alkalinema pantanalense TaxID=1620705 RepID=UPI003D6FFE5D